MKDIEFLEILERNCKYPPLLIADFNVLLWKVIHFYEENKYIYKKNGDKLIKLAAAYIFNRGPRFLPKNKYRVLVIADGPKDEYGGYWRHKEVLKDPRINIAWDKFQPKKKIRTYKGGRKEKNELYYKVYSIVENYCQEYLNFFRFDGYEADDIAGSIYRSKKIKENRERIKIFYTVDRDWTQLIDEENGFYWYSLRDPKKGEMFQYRAMNNSDVIEYAEKKMNYKISHPSEFVLAKVVNGDLGDGLPPNSPREYMDLISRHPKYSVERDYPELFPLMIDYASKIEPNNLLEHVEECELWFKKLKLDFKYTG